MSKFIALFLIFSFIKFSKTQDLITSSTEQLKAFIDCINKTESFPSNLKEKILTAWTNDDGSIYSVIGELLLTQSQYIQKCLNSYEHNINNTKTIYNGNLINNFDKIYATQDNWTDFLDCLEKYSNEPIKTKHGDKITFSSVIQDLINDIKQGNYVKALREQFRLQRFGNRIVYKCSKKLGYEKDDDNNDKHGRHRDWDRYDYRKPDSKK